MAGATATHRYSPKARGLLLVAILLAVVGLVLLVPPLGSPDWLRRPLSDDAYYYLVIARNAAAGHGVTYDGLPVTGFQPLYLLMCLPIGALAHWGLLATPAAITIVNWTLYNVAGAWLVASLWRRLYPGDSSGVVIAVSLWLLDPSGQRMALNGMETTLALLAWLLVAFIVAKTGPAPRSVGAALIHGSVLGIAFLARNDAIVLAGTYAAWNLASLVCAPRASRRQAAVRLAAAGAGFLLLALPWLIYTWRVSGFLVPQGGRAESAGGLYDFGRLYQTGAVLAALLRNTVPVPIAFLFQSTALRLAVGGALVAALSVSIGLAARRWGRPSRQALGFLAASVGLLAAIYATFFGAGHMAVRWLAPAVVLGVLIAAELVNDARRARRDAIRWLAMAGVLAVIAGRVSSVAIDARRESPTTTWGLLRAVEQVPGQVKIGSFQSGLLSWARPGVTNLDGKVNPAVLAALRERRFGAWLAQSDIDLVVDSNLLGLDSDPVLRRAFAIERRPDGVIVLSRAP